MKAIVLVEGNQHASVQDIPIPTPAEGEILVKVHYAAQNPTDWKTAIWALQPIGRVQGCDFAGVVVNPNGSDWREGQRVAGFVHGASANPIRGAFAEYVAIESSLVFAVPDDVSYQDAATIPLAFATAMQGVFQRLGLPEPDDEAGKARVAGAPVLIYGGASSVGLYAIQLAKLSGLTVITTASKRNHELLKSVGADAIVDYSEVDWIRQVRELSHDKLEYVLDTIGEFDTTKAVINTLAHTGGHVVSCQPVKRWDIGLKNPKVKLQTTSVYSVFERPISYMGFDNIGPYTPTPQDKAIWEKYLRLMPEYVLSGKIKPNPVRELGDIEEVLAGYKLHSEGKVSAEKLVYKIIA